jgi:predicted dienelactone hydrolase
VARQGLAIICVFAVAIAQYATAAAPTAVVNASVETFSKPGGFAVQPSEATWRDNVRNRDVPVRIYTPAATDVAKEKRFPVILFSHGLGGNRAGGRLWAEHWVSHGYVVVAMQHIGSDDSLWKDRPLGEREEGLKSGVTMNNLGKRVGDVRFVIDEIVRRTGAGDAAFARADPKRIGMSGHSFGAQTTLAVAGQKAPNLGGQAGLDTRIVAALAFSPNARNKNNPARQFGDIQIPFFSITGTEDGSILGDGTRYQDRMLPHEYMPLGDKYLLVFDGGDHMVFGGHTLGARRSETARDREIQMRVKSATLAFWNTTLKNDESAREWLLSGGLAAILDTRDKFAAK